MRYPFFHLPYAVAEAIDLSACARYPGVPEGADARVEASRGRGERSHVIAVQCGWDAVPLLIADIGRAMAHADDSILVAQCDRAIDAIRAAVAEAKQPSPDMQQPRDSSALRPGT